MPGLPVHHQLPLPREEPLSCECGLGKTGNPCPSAALVCNFTSFIWSLYFLSLFPLAVPLYKRYTFGSCPIVLGCSVLFFSFLSHLQSSFSLHFSLGSFYSRVLKFRDLSSAKSSLLLSPAKAFFILLLLFIFNISFDSFLESISASLPISSCVLSFSITALSVLIIVVLNPQSYSSNIPAVSESGSDVPLSLRSFLTFSLHNFFFVAEHDVLGKRLK